MHSHTAAMASQPASLAGHAGAHQHGALAKANVGNAAHSPMPCCPSEHAKSDCAQLCLQKCFGPLAVMPTATRAPAFEARRVRLRGGRAAVRLVGGAATSASPRLNFAYVCDRLARPRSRARVVERGP